MTGAIGGACHGLAAFPGEARATVATVNGLRLDELAAGLLAVWSAAGAGSGTSGRRPGP